MGESDRERWDSKYAGKLLPDRLTPNAWLAENRHLLPSGRAIDLACGLGHNAIWLARQGWQVDAWDISGEGLKLAAALAELEGAAVQWSACDLEQQPLPVNAYDVIVTTYYWQRDGLIDGILAALKPGGMLVYETFTLDQLQQPGNHLRDDRFLLRPNELWERFSTLRVRKYRDGIFDGKAVASLLAEKCER